jgi:hypothetical protein
MANLKWTCFDPDRPAEWTGSAFADFVASHRWMFARTMPRNPHEYTLRRETDDGMFEAAVPAGGHDPDQPEGVPMLRRDALRALLAADAAGRFAEPRVQLRPLIRALPGGRAHVIASAISMFVGSLMAVRVGQSVSIE